MGSCDQWPTLLCNNCSVDLSITMGHGFLKQAPIKTALLWLSCTLGLQRAGCETAISCISKNRFYKTKSPKQTTSNAFGQTVEKYDSVKKSALYWIWKAILSVHCDIYSDTLVGAHLRAHAHMLNEHKRGSNPLCSISHIPCTSTLSGQWVKKKYIYIYIENKYPLLEAEY